MPTRYTAAIKDGISFREYALNCSKAFGVLIHMRDSSNNAEIPQVIEPGNFHSKNIIKLESELKRIRSLPNSEAEKESKYEYQKECKRVDDRLEEILDQEKKYRKMLVKTKAYQPPSPDHIEYKSFMIKQIEQSIKVDCDTSYYKYPDLVDGVVWKTKKEKKILEDLLYHKKENLKEIKRCSTMTVWVQQMLKSLPDE